MSALLVAHIDDAEIEVMAKSRGGDGRTVTMLTTRYGVEAVAGDGRGGLSRELLERNVFARSIQQRGTSVPFVSGHWHDDDPMRDPTKVLARGAEWIDSEDGLRARVRIVAGPLGDHLLAQIDEGIIGGVSVGYAAIPARTKTERQKGRPPLHRRLEARLGHVAFVDEGAMTGAVIEAVAAATGVGAPRLTALRAQLAVVESRHI